MQSSTTEIENRITDLVRAIVNCPTYYNMERMGENLPDGKHGIYSVSIDSKRESIFLKIQIVESEHGM